VKIQTAFLRTAFAALLLGIAAVAATAQDSMPRIGVSAARPMPIATGNNLYCAGYIQSSGMSTENRIIGANDEADRNVYAQRDFLYINMGRNKGVQVGDTFSVVRPRGQVKSHWTNKSDIGFFVQEVGAVEVVSVKQEFAVAKVKVSCDNFLLGDLIQLTEKRNPPMFEVRPVLNLFSNPSGKAQGRILMGRDGVEMMAREFIVYVDLGADDNVKAGDHLTIFRTLGKGNVVGPYDRESMTARDFGYQSLVYKGGKFSNQAARKSGEHADGKEVTSGKAKDGRNSLKRVGTEHPGEEVSNENPFRKILGEAVVLNVKEKTATVIITRNAQEIHPGDKVEIQ